MIQAPGNPGAFFITIFVKFSNSLVKYIPSALYPSLIKIIFERA